MVMLTAVTFQQSGSGWGAFSPNVGSFPSGGSSGLSGFGGFGGLGGNAGISGFGSLGGSAGIGGFGGGLGGDWSGGSGVGVGGGSGDFGAPQPNGDGFNNSEPLGGYAGTTPSYQSITNLAPVNVTAPKPNSNSGSPISKLFDPTIRTLDTVTATVPYNPPELPYDPTIPTLDRVAAVPPDDVPVRDDAAFDAAFKDWSNREAVQVFAPFTGPIGALYEGVKAWLSRDWWGVGLGLAGLGFGPTLRFGGKIIRNSSLAGDVHPVTGIPFKNTGFPDFSGVAIREVKIKQTGHYRVDFSAANHASGLERTPRGYTWHHVEDGTTMQLVPSYLHLRTGHTGGVAINK